MYIYIYTIYNIYIYIYISGEKTKTTFKIRKIRNITGVKKNVSLNSLYIYIYIYIHKYFEKCVLSFKL